MASAYLKRMTNSPLPRQIQSKEGWVKHPLDEQLRANTPNQNLRSIPVRMIFNDPDLNLRAEYSLFDRQTGRASLCRQW